MVGGMAVATGRPADEAAVKGYLALALDSGDLAASVQLARRLRRWFEVAKVGLELFTAAGPDSVKALADEGFSVFLDLKLHDIPTTVAGAAGRARTLGATYLTVHASGGEAVLRAAVESFGRGLEETGGVLGVTVLTSEPAAPDALVAERAGLSARVGCRGLVCAARDLVVARRSAPDLLAVVPGIRLAGSSTDDQARVSTPAGAVVAGAKLLVIGRTVTAAPDPEVAAREVARQVAGALG